MSSGLGIATSFTLGLTLIVSARKAGHGGGWAGDGAGPKRGILSDSRLRNGRQECEGAMLKPGTLIRLYTLTPVTGGEDSIALPVRSGDQEQHIRVGCCALVASYDSTRSCYTLLILPDGSETYWHTNWFTGRQQCWEVVKEPDDE